MSSVSVRVLRETISQKYSGLEYEIPLKRHPSGTLLKKPSKISNRILLVVRLKCSCSCCGLGYMRKTTFFAHNFYWSNCIFGIDGQQAQI